MYSWNDPVSKFIGIIPNLSPLDVFEVNFGLSPLPSKSGKFYAGLVRDAKIPC